MSRFSLRPYEAADAPLWDRLTAASRNATFLLLRGYMDYHSDRFTDASLIIEKEGKPAVLFAASAGSDTVTAHGGLTYGGFILPMKGIDGADMCDIAALVADRLRGDGFRRLVYKPIPSIYHRNPADEDLYALWRLGATMSACGLSSAIDLRRPCHFNENMRRNARKALAAGVTCGPDPDALSEFHALLTEVLMEHHSVTPVHSAAELRLLASRFPDRIRLYTARDSAGTLLAGTLLYVTDRTVHAQYIAASAAGRALGALPALFSGIAASAEYSSHDYLDFGISTEHGGLTLNEGLHHQKQSMGGRSVIYPQFTLEL